MSQPIKIELLHRYLIRTERQQFTDIIVDEISPSGAYILCRVVTPLSKDDPTSFWAPREMFENFVLEALPLQIQVR